MELELTNIRKAILDVLIAAECEVNSLILVTVMTESSTQANQILRVVNAEVLCLKAYGIVKAKRVRSDVLRVEITEYGKYFG